MKLPNFFIIGAGKAGTTTLYGFLNAHPEVFMSPVKEPHYFCKDLFTEARASGRGGNATLEGKAIKRYLAAKKRALVHGALISEWDDYVQLFRDASGEKAVGEASPTYLPSRVAATEIHARIPDARIVAILRDPASRAFSHYVMNVRTNLTPVGCPFLEALKKSPLLLEEGMYHEHLARYYDVFGPERIRVYLTEDMKTDPRGLYDDLCGFLGVARGLELPEVEANVQAAPRFGILNRFLARHPRLNTGLRKAVLRFGPQPLRRGLKKLLLTRAELPRMTAEERAHVQEVCGEDIRKLSRLIHRDLSAWLA